VANPQTHSNSIVPQLTVVVGSNNARCSIEKCLHGLISQRNGQDIEIIVVDNSADGTADIVARNFPELKLVRCAEDKLMPELWEIGINQSTGELVAITTSHFVPSRTWVREILKAHESSFAGIGGAIENEPSSGIISWAVYFCRYSPYMLPFKEKMVSDFAGDNASYKRRALDHCAHARRNGFWESFVHQELRKEGFELALDPKIVIYHQKSFDLMSFIKQRFWHGRQFGTERALKLSPGKRFSYILLSPLIPSLYLFRITRRVLDKGRNFAHYLTSLPVLVLFLLSWSLGELSGYLFAANVERD
jgi:glycosyltransferase involved in cell wall biosynthesis